MSSNREKLKNMGGPAFENDPKRSKPFGAFNPMQQERIKIEALRAMVDDAVSFRKLFQKIQA